MKKGFYATSFMIMLLLAASTFSVAAQSVDVTGKWIMKVETNAGNGTPEFMLKQAGENVTGTYTGQLGESTVTGTLKGNAITLEFKAGAYAVVYTGTVEGITMKGKLVIGDVAEGTFTGTKEVK